MKRDWFCQKCNSYVDSSTVTFEETHDLCGNAVIVVDDEATEIAKKFYPNPDYVGEGVDITPAFREGFVQGYNFFKLGIKTN